MLVRKPPRRKSTRQSSGVGARTDGNTGSNRTTDPFPVQQHVSEMPMPNKEGTGNNGRDSQQPHMSHAANLEGTAIPVSDLGSRFRALAQLDLNVDLETEFSEEQTMENQQYIMPVIEEPRLENEDAGKSAQAANMDPNMEKAASRDTHPDHGQRSTPIPRTRIDTRMQQTSPAHVHAGRSATVAVSSGSTLPKPTDSGPKTGPSLNSLSQLKHRPPSRPAPQPEKQPTRPAHTQRNASNSTTPHRNGSSNDGSTHYAVTEEAIDRGGGRTRKDTEQCGLTYGRDDVACTPGTGHGRANQS